MMEWNTSDSKSAALIIEVTGASTNSCRTEKTRLEIKLDLSFGRTE